MDASGDCGSVDAVNLRDVGGLSLLRKTCWKMVQKPLPCERTGALVALGPGTRQLHSPRPHGWLGDSKQPSPGLLA